MRLINPYPDESIHGCICRTATSFGVSPVEMLKMIFGNAKITVHPYLTSNLSDISLCSELEVEKILTNHTLRPLFSWALPEYALNIMDIHADGHLVSRSCQLSNFKINTSKVVKYCPECVRSELYGRGVSQLHISHQIPGVVSCCIHKVLLIFVDIKGRNSIVSNLLPSDLCESNESSEICYQYSKFASFIISELQKGISIPLNYEAQLYEMGYANANGNILKNHFYDEVLSLISGLILCDGIVVPERSHASKFWSNILHSHNSSNPAKHILMQFVVSNLTGRCKIEDIPLMDTSGSINKSILNMYDAGRSINHIASSLHKSRAYVLRVLNVYRDYPLSVTGFICPKKIQEIQFLAWKGFKLNSISKVCKVPEHRVVSIISATKLLPEFRRKCRFESHRRRSRSKIKRFILSHPDTSRDVIRKENNSDYCWLLRMDTDWLKDILPKKFISINRR